MPLYLGLDCGGSTTRALVCDEEGNQVFEGLSGSANVASTDAELVAEHMKEALAGSPDVDSACGCFAGLLSQASKERALQNLKQFVNAKRYEVRPDYHAGWEAAPEGTDVLVIAGTGVVICSEVDGNLVKSSAGGYLLCDAGSAAAIGRAALRLTMITAKKMPASEAFWRSVEEQFGHREASEVIAVLYAVPLPGSALSGLAGTIAADAAEGWEYALSSINESLGGLAANLDEHCDEHLADRTKVVVALAGGVWKTDRLLQQIFRDKLASRNREYELGVVTNEPVTGAVKIAMKMTQ
ncbi:MAG: hypothetical protein IH944_05425 [Armatimonadetes bacterium]|nr:hypothetical protein [Armatimonadota bacterium]